MLPKPIQSTILACIAPALCLLAPSCGNANHTESPLPFEVVETEPGWPATVVGAGGVCPSDAPSFEGRVTGNTEIGVLVGTIVDVEPILDRVTATSNLEEVASVESFELGCFDTVRAKPGLRIGLADVSTSWGDGHLDEAVVNVNYGFGGFWHPSPRLVPHGERPRLVWARNPLVPPTVDESATLSAPAEGMEVLLFVRRMSDGLRMVYDRAHFLDESGRLVEQELSNVFPFGGCSFVVERVHDISVFEWLDEVRLATGAAELDISGRTRDIAATWCPDRAYQGPTNLVDETDETEELEELDEIQEPVDQ